MTLFDRCIDLQLKLEAAQSADTSTELLARGARLVGGLEETANYFHGVSHFRDGAEISGRPGIDVRAISRAVAAFRSGISQHGSAAFQHQPAASLAETAKGQRERAVRWVAARWRELFADYEALIARVQAETFVGNRSHRMVAQARAAKLQAVRSLDPVADTARIAESLGTDGDIGAWIAMIRVLGTQLQGAVAALDEERATLPPAVRAALQRAASDDGFPLTQLTDLLLTALREAGVDEHLVVRRR